MRRLGARARSISAGSLILLLAAELAAAGPIVRPALALTCNLGTTHDNNARQLSIAVWPATTPVGVKADIINYDPVYTAYNGAGTNMSVLLAGTGLTGWNQLGWIKYNFQQTRWIYIESEPGSHWQLWPAQAVGTLTWYEIDFNPNPPSPYFSFYVNGSNYSNGPNGAWPVSYQVMAETHDIHDQMPGDNSHYAGIVGPPQYKLQGGSWQTITSTMGTAFPSLFGVYNLNPGYYVWDKRCS